MGREHYRRIRLSARLPRPTGGTRRWKTFSSSAVPSLRRLSHWLRSPPDFDRYSIKSAERRAWWPKWVSPLDVEMWKRMAKIWWSRIFDFFRLRQWCWRFGVYFWNWKLELAGQGIVNYFVRNNNNTEIQKRWQWLKMSNSAWFNIDLRHIFCKIDTITWFLAWI